MKILIKISAVKIKEFCIHVLPIWAVISIAIYILIHLALPDWPDKDQKYQYWFLIIVYIFIYAISLFQGWFSVETEANSSKVMQNMITGSLNPKWPGFNWKSIFDYPKYIVDTQKHLNTEDSGDWSAKNDKMKGKWKVLWRVNTKCDKRNSNMIKYVQTTESNIASAIKLIVNGLMTDFCYNRKSDKVKVDRKTAITKDKFNDICGEYGIEIIDCGLEDIDYSDETEKARAAEREMEAFQKAVDALMDPKNPNRCKTVEEAEKIVKAKMLGGNYKQIEVTNSSNTPIVLNP